MYCESARSGSTARAVAAGHAAAMAHAITARQIALRKKREALNHHLDLFRGRSCSITIVEQRHVCILRARGRHATREQPLGDHPRVASPNRPERDASRLPAK